MALFRKKSLAFTLVELLVVIAIVGLLSTIVLAVTSGVSEQGRIAKSLQFSKHLENSLGDHLIGRWTFDETANLCGAGKVCDTSGWDNHGTMNNFVLPCGLVDDDTPSGQGGAMSFDGVDDYVEANPSISSANGSLTICGWFKRQTDSSTGYPFGIRSEDFSFGIVGDTQMSLQARRSNNLNGKLSGRFSVSAVNSLGISWHFFAMTQNDDFTKPPRAYLDGTELTVSLSSYYDTQRYTTFYIGKLNPAQGYFSGLVDEVHIYDTALIASQIQSQYYAGLDRLLTKKFISKTEYQERIKS